MTASLGVRQTDQEMMWFELMHGPAAKQPYLLELPEALRNDVARELRYLSTKGDRSDEHQVEGILHHVPFFSDLDHTGSQTSNVHVFFINGPHK